MIQQSKIVIKGISIFISISHGKRRGIQLIPLQPSATSSFLPAAKCRACPKLKLHAALEICSPGFSLCLPYSLPALCPPPPTPVFITEINLFSWILSTFISPGSVSPIILEPSQADKVLLGGEEKKVSGQRSHSPGDRVEGMAEEMGTVTSQALP